MGLIFIRHTLMKVFHQPYSEIMKIPLKEALFYISYEEALQFKINQDIDKQKAGLKG